MPKKSAYMKTLVFVKSLARRDMCRIDCDTVSPRVPDPGLDIRVLEIIWASLVKRDVGKRLIMASNER